MAASRTARSVSQPILSDLFPHEQHTNSCPVPRPLLQTLVYGRLLAVSGRRYKGTRLFNPDGNQEAWIAYGAVIDSQDRIVAVGELPFARDDVIARYTPDGQLDTTVERRPAMFRLRQMRDNARGWT